MALFSSASAFQELIASPDSARFLQSKAKLAKCSYGKT
jgi:hypothetical protein